MVFPGLRIVRALCIQFLVQLTVGKLRGGEEGGGGGGGERRDPKSHLLAFTAASIDENLRGSGEAMLVDTFSGSGSRRGDTSVAEDKSGSTTRNSRRPLANPCKR